MTVDKDIEQLITLNCVADASDRPELCGYAVAYAILQLASAQREVAYQLKQLGNGNAGSQMGALEFLATKVAEVSGSLGDIAAALEKI
jgi:hypothetical protein